MKKTRWFSRDEQPARVGWYECIGSFSDGDLVMRRWNGEHWQWACSEEVATLYGHKKGELLSAAFGYCDKWRGLTTKDGK